MIDTTKGYVTVTDENGNKIIDNVMLEMRICKENEIRKYKEDGTGLLHVWFEIPKVHFYEEVNGLPNPEFAVGDKVKIKSNPKIEWIIDKVNYDLRHNKYSYSMSRLSPKTSPNCSTYERRRAEDIRKIKED